MFFAYFTIFFFDRIDLVKIRFYKELLLKINCIDFILI